MNESLTVQSIGYNKVEIKEFLQEFDSQSAFTVNQLVYYPYYLFEYSVRRKGVFHSVDSLMGCTTDAVNGISSLIDMSPELTEKIIKEDHVIAPELDLEMGKKKAGDFVHNAISLKIKVLTLPEIQLQKQTLFYRPYWIVDCEADNNTHPMMVDAITAKYHPL